MGAKPMDMSEIREALADGRVWTALGLVVKRPNEDKHFQISDDDVLVDVDVMPDGQPIVARLGSAGGGFATGLWRVPPVGAEVMLLIPAGSMDADASICCVLSSGGPVDSDLDENTLLVVDPKKVLIKSTGDKVVIDGSGGGEIGAGATEPLMKGNALATAINNFATIVGTFAGAVSSALVPPNPGLATPVVTGATNLSSALESAKSQLYKVK